MTNDICIAKMKKAILMILDVNKTLDALYVKHEANASLELKEAA